MKIEVIMVTLAIILFVGVLAVLSWLNVHVTECEVEHSEPCKVSIRFIPRDE